MPARLHRPATAACAALIAIALALPAAVAAAEPSRRTEPTWRPPAGETVERLLVRYADRVSPTDRSRLAKAHGLRRVDDIQALDVEVLAGDGRDLAAVAEDLADQPGVLSVEADARWYPLADPTIEPRFGELWGMHNTGQTIGGFVGRPNVDIDLPQAHSVTTGDPAIVVAVIDDGVDFSHPDLAARAWTNPLEADGIPGEDDDDNGIVDDVNGVNYCGDEPTGEVFVDGGNHGTHVAGTIAASLDGDGVVGVAPTVRIMALKFLCAADGSDREVGETADAVAALLYAKAHGVRIANASWGGGGFSTLLRDTIRHSGMLFVAAAGNGGFDGRGDNNDKWATYPASYDVPNILSVAAVHNEGALSSFSNYGPTSVDLSAPGEDVLSTLPGGQYGYGHGTSMAAPHVTGVAALAASVRPGLLSDPVALKAHLMATTKPLPATKGRTVTGGMVDAMHAVDTVAPGTTAPAAYAFVPGTRVKTRVTTRIGWPAASDDLSGIATYTLGQSVDGGAWKVLATTSSTSSEERVPLNERLRHRVRARDRGTNYGVYTEGPAVRPRLFQQGTSLATYSGRWGTSRAPAASGGSTRFATRKGSSVTLRFTGRAVAIVVTKGPSRGSFKAYLDGKYVKTVSTHRKRTRTRLVVFARSWSTRGTHTLRLVVAGTAGHPRVDVDGFLVLQ